MSERVYKDPAILALMDELSEHHPEIFNYVLKCHDLGEALCYIAARLLMTS
jgi:uncharacterized protein (DUF779 family)